MIFKGIKCCEGIETRKLTDSNGILHYTSKTFFAYCRKHRVKYWNNFERKVKSGCLVIFIQVKSKKKKKFNHSLYCLNK